MFGKVLYLDGDEVYLKKCLNFYEKIGVFVYGIYCYEKKMVVLIEELFDKYWLDILVIIGYDVYFKYKGGVNDLSVYRYFKYFVEIV